jgi:UPF0042 nucleotide-binding protein
VSLLFLEAAETALVRRFSETRRPHPLAFNQPAIDGIREEREALKPIRKMADHILDTTDYTVHQLRDYIKEHYDLRAGASPLVVSVTSFAYRYGVPAEADLVFDVRFLPNPHFVRELRPLDGRSADVRDFVMKHDVSRDLLERLKDLLRFLLPCYEREGKAYLTVAIGCTGGRHRSVTFVEELRTFLDGLGFTPTVVHRDLDRE